MGSDYIKRPADQGGMVVLISLAVLKGLFVLKGLAVIRNTTITKYRAVLIGSICPNKCDSTNKLI